MLISRKFIPFLCQAFLSFGCAHARKKLIIDSDLFSDVDDAAALLIACTHPNVEFLGLNLNYPSTYSALAASSLLGYYNHSQVPVGLKRPFTNVTFFDDYFYKQGEYASKVAYNWRQNATLPWMDASSTWDPVALYRKLLAHEGDHTVTIASIGFLENLSDLLSSLPDSNSPLAGTELVASKVSELVVMGGQYPSGREFNFFGYNATAAAHVVSAWPGRITFSGFEMGEKVFSGGALTVEGPKNDPVNAAYRWYNGYNVPRESWDPLTVLYAIEGLGEAFEIGSKGGHNYVYPNGTNEWQPGNKQNASHQYLKLRVAPSMAGAILDRHLVTGAAKAAQNQ